PALSPDERSLLAGIAGDVSSQFLGVFDAASGALRHLTFEKELIAQPCWSADGQAVLYAANRTGTYGVYMRPVSGSGREEVVFPPEDGPAFPEAVSPDGRTLLFARNEKGHTNLWTIPLQGERKATPFAQSESHNLHGRFSPDGRFVAYTSDASGRP